MSSTDVSLNAAKVNEPQFTIDFPTMTRFLVTSTSWWQQRSCDKRSPGNRNPGNGDHLTAKTTHGNYSQLMSRSRIIRMVIKSYPERAT